MTRSSIVITHHALSRNDMSILKSNDPFIELTSLLYLNKSEIYKTFINMMLCVQYNIDKINNYININVDFNISINGDITYIFSNFDIDKVNRYIENIEQLMFLTFLDIGIYNSHYSQLLYAIKKIIDKYDFVYYTTIGNDEWKQRIDFVKNMSVLNKKPKTKKRQSSVKWYDPTTWISIDFDLDTAL
jgi:hypothetical protein